MKRFLLTGNKREYESFCAKFGESPDELRELNNADLLRGHGTLIIIRYGTWRDRGDLERIKKACYPSASFGTFRMIDITEAGGWF